MSDESRTALRNPADPDGVGQEPTQKVSNDIPMSVGTMRATPAPGTLIGSYVVEGVIGVGGMGIVLAARHAELGELAAIKLLHPKAATDEVQRERFVREARATVRIKSDHVVRVLDAGKDKVTGAPFIVMEHLEGRDLARILDTHGAMQVTTAVDLMMQICEAVAAAHALGIIHRDLKPSNFFVVERAGMPPLVKVLDFGISKASEQNGAQDPRLTETQAVFGSPTYMSPEQIRSSKNVDPRSDVWSLGVALFEMLTGKLPFIADNVSGLLASVVADAPFRVSVFAPHVPPELEAVVLGCLEKEPARRVGSAVELALLLAPYASPEGAQLAAQIERIGLLNSGTSGPSVRPSSAGASSTHPSLRPLVPLPSASRPSATGPGAVAFGNTGDLSATGPPLRTSRLGALLAALVAVLVGGGLIAAVLVLRRAPAVPQAASHAVEAPPSAELTPAPMPQPSVDPAAAPAPLPSASSPRGLASEEPPSVASARRPGRPLVPAIGASGRASPPRASATATAVAAPPTSAAPKPKPEDDRY